MHPLNVIPDKIIPDDNWNTAPFPVSRIIFENVVLVSPVVVKLPLPNTINAASVRVRVAVPVMLIPLSVSLPPDPATRLHPVPNCRSMLIEKFSSPSDPVVNVKTLAVDEKEDVTPKVAADSPLFVWMVTDFVPIASVVVSWSCIPPRKFTVDAAAPICDRARATVMQGEDAVRPHVGEEVPEVAET